MEADDSNLTYDYFLHRKCRYEKCLSIGMLPYLVDSCKRNHDNETTSCSTPSSTNSPSMEVAMIKYEPFSETVIKETLSDLFYMVYNKSSISKDLYLLGKYFSNVPLVYHVVFLQIVTFSSKCWRRKMM